MEPRQIKFRWADLDPNRHVRNSAYPDVFVEVRMEMFKNAGYSLKELGAQQIGPVVLQEHTYYIKEVQGDEVVHIDIQLGGHTEDKRYWQFAQHLYDHNGILSTYHEFTFAVMDLQQRKVVQPPRGMLDTFLQLPQIESFSIIDKSSLKIDRIPYDGRLIL